MTNVPSAPDDETLADTFIGLANAIQGSALAALDLWEELVGTLVDEKILTEQQALAMANRIVESSTRLESKNEVHRRSLENMADRLREDYGAASD